METLIGKQPESKFNASGILKPVTKIQIIRPPLLPFNVSGSIKKS
jgi:hypothetical protein